MRNKSTENYREISTGGDYHDSTAYVYRKLNNPRIVHFYKTYRKNISREQLTMYHRIHQYLSRKNIPTLYVSGTYEDKPYKNIIKLKILELDPKDISVAYNIEDQEGEYVTHPTYIDGDPMISHLNEKECRQVIEHLRQRLDDQGLLIDVFDRNNFRITEMKDGYLYITVTDIACRLLEVCIQNLKWINQTIPDRNDHTIETRYDLIKTLAANEAIAKPRKKTNTQ